MSKLKEAHEKGESPENVLGKVMDIKEKTLNSLKGPGNSTKKIIDKVK